MPTFWDFLRQSHDWFERDPYHMAILPSDIGLIFEMPYGEGAGKRRANHTVTYSTVHILRAYPEVTDLGAFRVGSGPIWTDSPKRFLSWEGYLRWLDRVCQCSCPAKRIIPCTRES